MYVILLTGWLAGLSKNALKKFTIAMDPIWRFTLIPDLNLSIYVYSARFIKQILKVDKVHYIPTITIHHRVFVYIW